MKAFASLLIDLNDGSTHSALTADFEELLRQVQATGRGGALKLALKVTPITKNSGGGVDKINITAEIKVELPKPPQPTDFFWLDDNSEPTRQHPRQGELPLRTVAGAAAPTQEIANTDADGVITYKQV